MSEKTSSPEDWKQAEPLDSCVRFERAELWRRCRVIRPTDGLVFSCWLPHPAPEPNSVAVLECGTRVIVLEHDMLWADEAAKQRCHELAEALARRNLDQRLES